MFPGGEAFREKTAAERGDRRLFASDHKLWNERFAERHGFHQDLDPDGDLRLFGVGRVLVFDLDDGESLQNIRFVIIDYNTIQGETDQSINILYVCPLGCHHRLKWFIS